jgi:hypothetical protein
LIANGTDEQPVAATEAHESADLWVSPADREEVFEAKTGAVEQRGHALNPRPHRSSAETTSVSVSGSRPDCSQQTRTSRC